MKRLNAATIAQTVSAIDSDDMCPLYPTGSSHETRGTCGFVLVAFDSDFGRHGRRPSDELSPVVPCAVALLSPSWRRRLQRS